MLLVGAGGKFGHYAAEGAVGGDFGIEGLGVDVAGLGADDGGGGFVAGGFDGEDI